MDEQDDFILYDELTERELQILRLIGRGYTNQEIANELFLAYNTVRDYASTSHIYSKLGVKNRREAVKRAERLGLLEEANGSPKEVNRNLPAQTTPFVGRGEHVAKLAACIQQNRLVTVHGIGGIGKTRLVLAVAEQVASRFKDGVYFVPLAPIQNPEQIIPTIAKQLHFRLQQDQRSPLQQLQDFLRNKQLLLVLDNFEHLLQGVDAVNTLLHAAPNVKIVVTSRERLNLQGEVVYTLDGLNFPSSVSDLDTAQTYDAIALFVQSARRICSDLTLTNATLYQIIRICQLVDGMPLGIVLAASWVDMLSPQEIATEVEQSMDFLVTELRDTPKRQHSIRAIFEALWKRLTPIQQTIFMKLSVFRGGFTFDAAVAVTGTSLRELRRLHDLAVLSGNRNGRYELHELLRQYAENKLQETSANYYQTRASHCVYYADRMENQEDNFAVKPQVILQECEAEFENVQVAWNWAVDHLLTDALWKILHGFTWFYYLGGHYHIGVRAISRAIIALDAVSNHQHQALLAGLLSTRTFLNTYLDSTQSMLESAERAVALFDGLDLSHPSYHLLRAYSNLGFALRLIDPLKAQKIYERTAHIAERIGYSHEQQVAVWHWTFIQLIVLGRTEQVKAKVNQLFELSRQSNSDRFLDLCKMMLATLHFYEHRYRDAQDLLEQALLTFKQLREQPNILGIHMMLGRIALAQEKFDKAQQHFSNALKYTKNMGWARLVKELFVCIAEWMLATERTHDALKLIAFAYTQSDGVFLNEVQGRVENLLTILQSQVAKDTYNLAFENAKSLTLDVVMRDLQTRFDSLK